MTVRNGITHVDYVVVGAGAAGCVVANRLSADPEARVLLLEAGGRDSSPLVHLPAGFTRLSGPRHNWEYSTVAQRELDQRRLWYPQGRTLGGGTSVNAMLYVRGQREDFERWAARGNPDWSYERVLPFFRRAEANERLRDRFHSGVGAVNVTGQTSRNVLSQAFVDAAQELGVPFTADFNGAVQEGVGWYDVTQKDARRVSTATAYLKPVRSRPNLVVQTRAHARRLRVAAGRVVGLDYTVDGQPRSAFATREVILSAGAVNTPRLLLLSGIGPAHELRDVGVDVVHDLPGVGKNLQDHLAVYLTAATTPVGYSGTSRLDKVVLAALRYLTTRTGPITATVCEAGMFVRSSPDVATPDVQMHAMPLYLVDHGFPRVRGHGMTINACHLRPRSTGEVTLRSADSSVPPAIDPAYLTDPYDWEKTVQAFRRSREVLRSHAFKPYVVAETLPAADVRTDADIRAYVRQRAKTDYHPVGTCAMGDDEAAVVDQQLRVRGLDGLRVIDSSVMPTLVSGNTMATSTMIGEKGAHHVLHGLVPPVLADAPV